MTEQELIKGCKKNDRRCQNALYKRYFSFMSSIACRYCKEDEVIELINAGFLKVLQNIKKYDQSFSLATWIRTILVRTMIDHYRTERSKLVVLELDEYSGDEHGALNYNIGESLLNQDDLLQLLNGLPTVSRKVFNLFAIDGYSHKEIADLLNIKVGTSKWHLANARKLLQKALLQEDKEEKKMEVLRNEA